MEWLGVAMTDHVRELTQETQAALALIESLQHIIGDDDDAKADAVEGETNLHEAIGDAVKRIVELQALDAALEKIVLEAQARRGRFDAQRERIRSAIGMAMEAGGIKKLELPLGTISLKAVPPKVEITDESAIPAHFFKTQEPKLDKRLVMDALKAKQDVPGAMLSNGGVTVNMRLS